jgi:ribosomal protein S18 acetylase RimI-like enzyme
VVQYRSFRNTDPPHLVDIWNQALTGRGAVPLNHSNALERSVFSRPYFDPEGLILAEEASTPVGFVHAGFGPNEQESALNPAVGVICMLAVRPAHQRRGVGSELLRRAEAYLAGRGAQTIYAGPMRPLHPFYLGIYGGSEMPGFLDSDPTAAPFFTRHGYEECDRCLVFQRRLDKPISLADARFSQHRRRFDIRILPQISIGTWWQECVLGVIEPVEFRLEEKTNGMPAARLIAWEMEGFNWRWNQPSVGIWDLQVREPLRRQGLAKYLLTQILHHLQEQFFGIVEVQMMADNEPAVALFRGLGFQQVDTGRIFRKK